MEQNPSRRKPGPLPGTPTRQYVVLLEETTAEWGKQQPGGLSRLLRLLLKEAYRRAQNREGREWEEAF